MTTIATIKLPNTNSAKGFNKTIETEKAYGFIDTDGAVIWLPKKAVSLKARINNELGTILCFNLAHWFKLSADQKARLSVN